MTPAPTQLARSLILAGWVFVSFAAVTSAEPGAPGEAIIGQHAVPQPMGKTATAVVEDEELLRRPSRVKPQVSARRAESSFGVPGGSMVFPLMIVVATICGSAYFFRRWVNPTHKIGGEGAIKVLARQYLSSKQCLCLVRLGPRLVLLGVTPERITAVAGFDDPEEVAGIIGDVNRAGSGAFSAALAAFAGRRTGEAENARQAAEPNDIVLPGKVFETRSNVRDVLGRIRALSGRGVPVEPA